MIDKTICFTGHRPNKLGGYDENNPIAKYVKDQLNAEILNAILHGGYTRFIAGGALGVDTWAAEEVLYFRDEVGLDITLELFAPFEGQEVKWFEESKKRYFSIMERCNKVVNVCEPGYAAWKMIVRDKAMVDESGLVMAVWNGDLGRSGTGHTVEYAREKNRKMIVIDPRNYK
ncbi:SLOG family protein [Paenibacillus xylanexedens]|uniref:SLOG family protein n=1 Tax=Paenibacillus xylanexedens TaxID=528191 RepID=UPI000F5385F6|nr:SLOG family protein [Paenibacillus xylanexedens]RPK20034.1 hypothetical protein EDO6_06551 [Paenibacillus xylanexedens]